MTDISPILLREEIARRLRAARTAAGIRTLDAAHQLDLDRTVLCRIELGKRGIDVHLARTMMDLYDFRDDDLLDLVRASKKLGWWKPHGIADDDFVALEAGASLESIFEVQLIPGLLQTADYTRALLTADRTSRSTQWIDERLQVRLRRQDRLTDDHAPITLDAVIDENALRQPVGGPHPMQAQLRHLALVAELPTVTLRILPTSVICTERLHGTVTILDFAHPGQSSVAYARHALGEHRTADHDLVRAAQRRFAHLRSLALDPEGSVALIDQVANELATS